MSKSTFSYEDAYGQAPVGSSPSSKQAGNISYEDAFGLDPAAPASRGIKGVAQDVAATAVKAALAVPEAAVGVADLVTGGRAGKALEGMGVRIKDAREIAEGWHSDTTKAQKQEFQKAEGVVDKAKVALANPSLIAMGVGESLGAMGAGGLVGRGLTAATRLGQMGAKGAALAGAAGEGVVGAGSAAEQIRQQTEDGELTAKQAALAAGTGVATGVLGAVGGKVANRLGIGDADTMMAQGMKGMAKDTAGQAVADAVNPLVAQAAKKSILRQMGEGAISEGVLEELPQSVSEQILQNEALNKPWSEGLDEAIVMGILSGGAMGASAAGFHGYKGKQLDDATRKAQEAQAAAVQAGTAQAGAAPAAQWTTSAGAADPRAQAGTAPASPANAPNLDYETLPGAAPGAMGNEVPFEREFDTAGLSLQGEDASAQGLDKTGALAREWDTGSLSLAGDNPQPVAPSVSMGLDATKGGLTKAAALAVDSGASPVVQQSAAPVAPVAPVAEQPAPQVPAGVDPETGEVSLQAQMDEIKGRIAFMQQQGAAQGWNKEMVNQRNALQSQLTKLEVQSAKENKQGASTTGAPAPVKLTGITQILTKQIPDMSAGELQQAIAHYGPNHKRTKKLEKALQALAQKPMVAIETGVKTNGTETSQTQQGSPQPAQAGPAQASATAQQSAVTQSQKIAHEGNALREQQRQRLVDASERWTRMTGMERQALTEGLKTMNVLTRKNVHTRPWADLSDKVRSQLADAISAQNSPVVQENNTLAAIKNEANSALAKQEAQSMADAKPFAPETGTLGIPRADMPQVPTANHGGLVKHLNAQGIAHETKTVDAADLKPTQAEFSPSKVEAAKSASGDRAVIVSSDGHIIDGHHQAVAAAEEGKQVKAIVLDAPVEKALEAVKASPSADADASTTPAPYKGKDADKIGPAIAAVREHVDGAIDKATLIERLRPLGLTEAQVGAVTYKLGDDFTAADIRAVLTQPEPAAANDFPVSEAVQSYSGISHTGRTRAEGDKQAFDKFMKEAEAAGDGLAETDAQREAMSAAVEQLRADYLQQYRSLMNVRAGTYSGFVAGRGNLNSKQANARTSALDKAMERFNAWVGDNVDRVSKAVLAARTPEQVKADQAAAAARIQEKADKKAADLKATLLKFMGFKSGDNMPYGKNVIITKVSYDRDGYPSSLTFKMVDGSPVTDDKLNLVEVLKDKGETLDQAKARIRALVDEVRAENPELTKGAGAIRAAASAKAEKPAPAQAPAPATHLDRHNAIEDGISTGTLVLADYQSAFAELEANQEAVVAELSKLTKEKLLRAGGPAFTYRMKDDKKDAIVLAAYQKMLDTYALGRSYGSSSYFLSAASIAKNKADKAQALREMVANTTAEDLAARAAEIKAARDELKAQRDAAAEALANPKSLQDFRGFMRHWMDRGETMNQAYLRLSPEQRQQYDALEAAQSKDGREAAKRRAMVSVASAGDTTAGEVIATKHTKHGHDLFVVKLAERVERDAYDTLNSSAKRLGGSYSSYRGNGAVPGFQFRTREAAEAFQKLVGGDTAQAQELANQRRDAFDDDKSQSAAERLRTMAEALEERASEALGADC